jgi:hypothetical protein
MCTVVTRCLGAIALDDVPDAVHVAGYEVGRLTRTPLLGLGGRGAYG